MKLKKNQKLMIYIDNFCLYTTVKEVQDKKILDLLDKMENSQSVGTRLDMTDFQGKEKSYNVQINLIN